ncbi:conserved protein, unknown function [Hepatocystis sp. ex Piliocolobus tephrosceles]|nr:conserved protein, unknown function [Hepatocystis sp. ex Piliocolobus tephrosceles]
MKLFFDNFFFFIWFVIIIKLILLKETFKIRALQLKPFENQQKKKEIKKNVELLRVAHNELKNNIDDLERTFDYFVKSLSISSETEKKLYKMNDLKMRSFINQMEELKKEYDKFNNSIGENLNKKKNEFNYILKNTIKALFYENVVELKGVSKYINYINTNVFNLNKIISNVFSKVLHLTNIYEHNIKTIYEIGQKYYEYKLKKVSNALITEFNNFNKTLKLISNEKYIDNFTDVYFIETLKNYLLNSNEQITMMDVSNFLDENTFLEISYFFNSFLKNYNKGIIIYIINRTDINNHQNNKMIFIQICDILKLIHFIKLNYNKLEINYIAIHIYNVYVSIFFNSNNILYYVNNDFFFNNKLIRFYNSYNYGYFFTNQNIKCEQYQTYQESSNYIYIFYLGNRMVEDNFLIFNKKQMIELKKENAYKIIQKNNFSSHDYFFNVYKLKLESEYNFYQNFINKKHEYSYTFHIYDCKVMLAYDSVNKLNIPNELFTSHFKDVYIIIIIYPGNDLNMFCNLFNNYIFTESIYNIRKESNVLEIYMDYNKLTLIINNKMKTYNININNKKKNKSLKNNLDQIQKCLKHYIKNNYTSYFDYLNIFYFISSD